jgi:hypothetical protein
MHGTACCLNLERRQIETTQLLGIGDRVDRDAF